MLGRPPSLEGQVPGRGPPRRGSETRNQGPSWKRTPGRAQAETRLLSVSSQVASGDTCAPTWEACPQTQAGVPPPRVGGFAGQAPVLLARWLEWPFADVTSRGRQSSTSDALSFAGVRCPGPCAGVSHPPPLQPPASPHRGSFRGCQMGWPPWTPEALGFRKERWWPSSLHPHNLPHIKPPPSLSGPGFPGEQLDICAGSPVTWESLHCGDLGWEVLGGDFLHPVCGGADQARGASTAGVPEGCQGPGGPAGCVVTVGPGGPLLCLYPQAL